ncbi:hypothetical protein FSP39_009372 [Pinctada imbricata]|uniref:Inositol 2-dehydrogenase n=1 Tax=Pinctada imbricata TaxID=66713 RepID=A0AA89CAQ3_PINIB|nr:hypothetical protein FSP39_009372 [Pinctada imbricata]
MTKHVVAIFGIGRIGQVHLKNLVNCNRVVVKWIVDAGCMKEKAHGLIDQLRLQGETTFVEIEKSDKVFANDEVEAVFVCVPTSFHAEIAIKALNAGKHVFCEKPLAATLQEVKECYETAKKNNKTLMCAVNRRFDPQFNGIYQMKNEGKLGKIRIIKMTGSDMGNTEEYYKNNPGGIFMDMGIHDVDYICWLAGEKPSSVYATGCRCGTSAEMYARVGEYDTASAIFTFPSGISAHLELSRECGYGYGQNVEVLGTKSLIRSHDLKETELERVTKEGHHLDAVVECFTTRFEKSFQAEIHHFLDVIEGKCECLVSPESYIISTEVVIALTESLDNGDVIKF